jgi:hypothetical protein
MNSDASADAGSELAEFPMGTAGESRPDKRNIVDIDVAGLEATFDGMSLHPTASAYFLSYLA